MIENPGIGNLRNVLTPDQNSGRSLSFRIGSIVKAQVIDINDKGEAVLRFASSGGDKGSSQGTIVRAFSEVPLTKGQNIFLEILGGKDNIAMRFMGDIRSAPGSPHQNIPVKFLNMLSQLSGSKAGNAEFHHLVHMLKSLPQQIKTAIPGFQNLEKLLLDVQQIDGKLLKAFVETSGVAFETRLRIAVLTDPSSMLQSLMALQAEGDLKALLMKLQKLLKDRNITLALKQSGHNVTEISASVEKILKNIEFFQLTSKLNDMFCTFLPVLWDDLKDGEFLFRRNDNKGGKSYTCDINLDLASLGRLSISVTVLDRSFYVTFFTERQDVRALIQSQKSTLESRFIAQGLPLKAMNFKHKKIIPFGKAADQGVNVKI